MTTSFTTGIRRRQNLRLVLFVIILGTLPFYCAGIFLWGSAPQAGGPRTATPTTAGRATVTPLPTRTPGGLAFTPGVLPTGGLLNTPGQFFPTTGPAIQPTFNFFPTATFIFPIDPTVAPTLTPVIFPTATNPPIATDTALPFDTPIPDSDGDGLADNFDPCPGVPWPETGCPPTETPSETPIGP